MTEQEKAIAFLTAVKAAMDENDIHGIVIHPSVDHQTGRIVLDASIEGYVMYDDDDTGRPEPSIDSFLTVSLKNPMTYNIFRGTIDKMISGLQEQLHFLTAYDLGIDDSEAAERAQKEALASLLNKKVAGQVVKVTSCGALISIKPGIFGWLYKSEWTPEAEVTVGDFIMAYATDIDKYTPRLVLRHMVG